MPAPAATFHGLFGRPASVEVDAPGRVNLIGEHTDYNDGFMLPAPIPLRARVALAPAPGATVRAWSANITRGPHQGRIVEYELGAETRTRGWIDYVQGVTAVLREAGHRLGGFDLRIDSQVPLGSGLSSSAALLVAVMRAVRAAFDLPIDDVAVATLARRAENTLVGAPVGIMDQLVASLGRPDHALFIDARSLAVEHVPLPRGAELVVIDSNIHHSHAGGEYRTRRAECEQACAALGVASLRDVDTAAIADGRLAALAAPLDRRARHVVSENARVLDAVARLRAGDLEAVGRILADGHASLRDDYAVSTPEIDLLVTLAAEAPGVYGARLTGGGFGGSIVAVAREGRGRAAADGVAETYRARTGKTATVVLPR